MQKQLKKIPSICHHCPVSLTRKSNLNRKLFHWTLYSIVNCKFKLTSKTRVRKLFICNSINTFSSLFSFHLFQSSAWRAGQLGAERSDKQLLLPCLSSGPWRGETDPSHSSPDRQRELLVSPSHLLAAPQQAAHCPPYPDPPTAAGQLHRQQRGRAGPADVLDVPPVAPLLLHVYPDCRTGTCRQ